MAETVASESVIDSLRNDFDALLDACWAEIEETAAPGLLAALHADVLRERRVNALYYWETLLMRDLCLLKLRRGNRRERGELAELEHRAQALRVAALARLREGRRTPRRTGPKGYEQVCAWVLSLLLPTEYEAAFANAMSACGLDPLRTRLPSRDWWRWAVTHGWLTETPTPEARRLLALEEAGFAAVVRRALGGARVPGSDHPAVAERWYATFKALELVLRAELDDAVAAARPLSGAALEAALPRVVERYDQLAELRVQRREALRRYLDSRDTIVELVDAATDSVRKWCGTAAAEEVGRVHRALWERVRRVVWEHRDSWDRAEFTLFGTGGGELADRLRLAVRSTVPPRPAPDGEPTAPRPVAGIPSGPLTVAADASGYGEVGGYGWAAEDGRSRSGRCVDGRSSVESEIIAICETAAAPELFERELHILSDCEQAVTAVNTAVRRRAADGVPFPVSDRVLDHVDRALGRPLPFRAQWTRGHGGHPLNEQAHRLARAARW
ncbi:RNase H family protein [Nocardia sp. CC227C]|uniref:RNase H family protein n=1 Tax=Nocardia sp. CC227C TaxID=3044562 RepID=UPI00278BD023|nr:RNase H family protein [Nocardia sp. CC227C]